jgi:hypothetical protein
VVCKVLEWLESLHSVRSIGDGQVQQLNVHDYYDLGKKIDNIEREIAKAGDVDYPKRGIAWPLFILRWSLDAIIKEPCALLPASQRAARAVIKSIDGLIPESIDDIFNIDKSEMIRSYQLSSLGTTFKNFETVLKNDMPEMSTFAVAQIGIYRTEDLINKSFLQVAEDLRPLLMPLALKDISEAGKCLAFRVPTAAAFHLSRAIETGMNQYYEALTGKPYQLKDAARNWAVKTDELKKAGADEKITEFLVHIRKAYRNPITHPDVILEPYEAFNFFSQSMGLISIMLAAVKEITEKNQPSLPGLTGGMYEAATAALGAAFDGVRSSDEEDILSLEAGATETA